MSYSKPFAQMTLPFGVTSDTVTVPALLAGGVVTTSSLSVTETTPAASLSPKLTSDGSEAELRPEPFIETSVPPPNGPELGLIEVISGGVDMSRVPARNFS